MRQPSRFALHKVSFAALVLALCALAPAARAVITVTVGGASSGSVYKFGLAACEGTDAVNHPSTVTGTYTLSSASADTLAVFATADSGCTKPTTTTAGVTYVPSSTSSTAGTFSVNLPALLLGTACSASMASPTTPGTVYVCVTLTAANATAPAETGYVKVQYSTTKPAAPPVGGFVINPGNQQLHVSWTPADASVTITHWHLYCEADGSDAGISSIFDMAHYSTDVASGTSGSITQTSDEQMALVNGQSYSIAITATDSYGNESDFSGISSGNIPYPVDDFYQYYRDKGGSALGCASSDGAAWMALIAGLLFVVLRARKARRGAAGMTLCLAIFAAGSARAADSDYAASDFSVVSVRAPRRIFFGLEFDRYKPQVDSEKDLKGATPYMDIFQHRVPWRVQAELGLEAIHSKYVGTFVVGVSAGFWQNIGKGIFSGGPQDGQSSSDTTLFDIWPVGVEAQWRLDMFTDRFRWLPLIPYAKAGLMGGIWAIYSGNGDVASSASSSATPSSAAHTSGRGQGITYGYTTAVGCAIALDAIDPGISNEAYLDLGLQRTAVFAEYGWTRLDGFHSSGNLILTDRGWRFGLSLEF
jgi:hypothetical protein